MTCCRAGLATILWKAINTEAAQAIVAVLRRRAVRGEASSLVAVAAVPVAAVAPVAAAGVGDAPADMEEVVPAAEAPHPGGEDRVRSHSLPFKGRVPEGRDGVCNLSREYLAAKIIQTPPLSLPLKGGERLRID